MASKKIQKQSFPRRYEMLKKYSLFTLIVLAAFTIFFAWHGLQIKSTYSLADFFPKNDPETIFFNQFRHTFKLKNESMVIGLRASERVFEYEFLSRLQALEKHLDTLSAIEEINSPLSLTYQVRVPLLGIVHSEPYLHVEAPEQYLVDSINLFQNSELADHFFSKDRRSVLMVLQHQPNLSRADKLILVETIKTNLKALAFEDAKLGGVLVTESFLLGLIKSETLIFLLLALSFIIGFLWIAFRTVYGIVLPLLVVIISLIWLLGLMVLSGAALGLLSNILPCIVLVIGLADSIHILNRYQEESRLHSTNSQAILAAIRHVGTANFLTSLTTALGFLTLLSCSVKPVQELGIYAAVGILIALLISYTLLPAILYMLPITFRPKPKKKKSLSNITRFLFESSKNKSKFILYAAIILFIFGVAGTANLEKNSYLIEPLRGEHKLRDDINFFEEEFVGLRSFELSVRPRHHSDDFTEPRLYAQLQELEKYLEEVYGVEQRLSILSFYRQFDSIFGEKRDSTYTPEELNKRFRFFSKKRQISGYEHWISEDKRELRISGRMDDVGTKILAERERALQVFSQKECPDLVLHQSGISVLLDRNNHLMADNIFYGLMLAIVVVAGIVAILFRSWLIVWIVLFINVLPLLVIGGVMGLMGIDLKLSTSIIFSIAFGIAVDDSLHFLCRFREEIRLHKNVSEAIEKTFQSTGKAIILTSCILIGGFISLSFSSVYGTFYLGVFTCMILFVALIIDLLLLPVLLEIFIGRTMSTKYS